MKTKLLLVEDDDAVHCALAEVLQEEGYDLVHAYGTADAILATQLNEEIRLVLLDLKLCGENGWNLFERLRKTNPVLPIIIITARSDQRALAEAVGVVALMEKPLNIPTLLELIAQLIAERTGRLTVHAPHALYSHPGEPCGKP